MAKTRGTGLLMAILQNWTIPAPQSAAERAIRPSLTLHRIRNRLKIVACPDSDCG